MSPAGKRPQRPAPNEHTDTPRRGCDDQPSVSPLQTIRYPAACSNCGHAIAAGTRAHRSQTHYRCQTCGPFPPLSGPVTTIPQAHAAERQNPIGGRVRASGYVAAQRKGRHRNH